MGQGPRRPSRKIILWLIMRSCGCYVLRLQSNVKTDSTYLVWGRFGHQKNTKKVIFVFHWFAAYPTLCATSTPVQLIELLNCTGPVVLPAWGLWAQLPMVFLHGGHHQRHDGGQVRGPVLRARAFLDGGFSVRTGKLAMGWRSFPLTIAPIHEL